MYIMLIVYFVKKNNCSFSIKCLSEGIAQYLSNQKSDSVLKFNYSLSEILTSNQCYNGWYLVTKYIIEKYPRELFIELLKDNNRAEKFIKDKYERLYALINEIPKGTILHNDIVEILIDIDDLDMYKIFWVLT